MFDKQRAAIGEAAQAFFLTRYRRRRARLYDEYAPDVGLFTMFSPEMLERNADLRALLANPDDEVALGGLIAQALLLRRYPTVWSRVKRRSAKIAYRWLDRALTGTSLHKRWQAAIRPEDPRGMVIDAEAPVPIAGRWCDLNGASEASDASQL